MNIFQFFRSAPILEEIQDEKVVKRSYAYWRLRIFLGMYIGYASYYLTRKSFTFAMPALQSEFGFGKFEIGLLSSVLFLTYGLSKFVSGILGDKSNPRFFMAIGLILTGIFNIFFGFSSALWTFAFFWGLNGWFQGFGWPGCAKLLTYWYSQNERGRWWSAWNTSHNLGGTLVPIIVAFFAYYFGWRVAMNAVGITCILIGFFLIYCLRDTPQSLGLPSIEKFRNDHSGLQQKEKQELSSREILVQYVLNNKYIWILAFASFFIYIIRTAVNDWSMLYLVEVKGYEQLTAGMCVGCFEAGGFFGSLAAGWSSDLIFKGRRNPVNAICSALILVLLLCVQGFSSTLPYLDAAFLFLIGFFVFGPQMLIGMAAAELSHKRAAATATGFAGTFAYAGAAVAGAPLGAVMQYFGWNSFLYSLFGCALISTLLLTPLWSIQSRDDTVLEGEAEMS